MRRITALLHTKDDGLRLGRCLETLYPCDAIVVVDHGSHDDTLRVAHEYGAKVLTAMPGASPEHYLAKSNSALPQWFLFLEAREALTEGLAASLYEWKSANSVSPDKMVLGRPFSVFLREETPAGWVEVATPKTRFVPESWRRWEGKLPADEPTARSLDGELLRFAFP